MLVGFKLQQDVCENVYEQIFFFFFLFFFSGGYYMQQSPQSLIIQVSMNKDVRI